MTDHVKPVTHDEAHAPVNTEDLKHDHDDHEHDHEDAVNDPRSQLTADVIPPQHDEPPQGEDVKAPSHKEPPQSQDVKPAGAGLAAADEDEE